MTDPKVTKEIQDWLLKDPKTNDMALPGALLLQRLNPRNMAYRRWLSVANTRPMAILAKIEYELKKHLRYRLDGLTLEEVRRLDQKVVPEAEHILSEEGPRKSLLQSTPKALTVARPKLTVAQMLEAATTSMRRLRSWESAKIMTSCLIASSSCG